VRIRDIKLSYACKKGVERGRRFTGRSSRRYRGEDRSIKQPRNTIVEVVDLRQTARQRQFPVKTRSRVIRSRSTYRALTRLITDTAVLPTPRCPSVRPSYVRFKWFFMQFSSLIGRDVAGHNSSVWVSPKTGCFNSTAG